MIEVNAADKATRRRRGKTDTLDAEAAARAVLSGRARGSAKAGDGPVEMLRMLKLAKGSAVKARTQTINQLKAVLVAADPALREALSGLTNTMLIRRCAQLEATTPADVTSAAVYTLRLLARRILELTTEIHDLVHHITTTITLHCPRLLTRRGVGPDNAATLLITAGDNPLRGQPPRRILRQDQPSPAQPRRRPTSQLRALPHHHLPTTLRRSHPRLPRPSHHPRQNPPRSHPLPQALPRPRDLPDHRLPTRSPSHQRLDIYRGISGPSAPWSWLPQRRAPQ